MQQPLTIGKNDLNALHASQQFASTVWSDYHVLVDLNPDWQSNDVRLNFVSSVATTASIHYSNQLLFHQYGKSEDWIKKIIETDSSKFYKDELGMQLGYSNFLINCIIVESRLRLLVRALDSHACNEACDPFESIITWILKLLGLQNHLETMLLFKELRNLIHNNGVYLHKSKQTKGPFTFRGETYLFEHGKRPNAHVYHVTFNLVVAAYEVMRSIINHERIKNIREINMT